MEKIDVEASPKSGDAKEEEAKESPHSPLGASSPSEKHQQPGSSERLKDFKKGLDSDAARGRRAQGTAAAVKEKRDERLLAMRMGEMNLGGAVPGARAGRREAEEGVRDSIVQWVEMLRSEDPLRQLEAVTHLRKLLSIEHNPPIAEVVACGVVPRLVEFLTAGAWPQLVFESAWALTNIASGSSEHTRVVMDAGAVPIFVQLLASREDDVKEQSVWALGNIAGDSAPCRDFILQHNVVPQLLLTLQNATKISLLRNAAWTLSNLCRGKPQPDFELLRPLVPTLARLIYSTDDEVVTDSCWALSYLSDGPNERIQAIMEAGVARRLCELMMHANYAIQTPALRTIGNFVTGDDVQTAAVLNVGVLPCLHAMLSSPKKGIRKEACWTVSNITAGNRQQVLWCTSFFFSLSRVFCGADSASH
jgi:importin subunit alpha-1